MPAEEADPLDQMLMAAATSARTRFFSGPDGPADGASSDIEDQFLTGPAPGGPVMLTGGMPPMFHPDLTPVDFAACGRALKKQRTLSPRSEEDFESYFNVNSQAEHMPRLCLGVLECRDLLHSAAAGKAYTIPDDVKDALTGYAQVFILSPATLFYKKRSCPTTVLARYLSSVCLLHPNPLAQAAMRMLKVSSIPAEHDVGRAEVVLKGITKALTDARHHVKEQIQESLKSDEKGIKVDVASLTYDCIGSTKGVKPTLGLFICVAFLRWVMRNYPDKVSKFWDHVDAQLEAIRKKNVTAAEREATFKHLYDDDINKFGTPDPDHPAVSPDRVEEWVKTVNRFAAASSSALHLSSYFDYFLTIHALFCLIIMT